MWKFDSNVIKDAWSHPQVLIRPRLWPLRHRIRGRKALLCSFNGKLGFMMIYVGDFSLFHRFPQANPPFGDGEWNGTIWNPLLYDFLANPRQITTSLLKSQASAANLIAVLISTTFRWEASCLRSYLLGWRLETKKSRWMLEVGSQTFLMLILICQLRRGYCFKIIQDLTSQKGGSPFFGALLSLSENVSDQQGL